MEVQGDDEAVGDNASVDFQNHLLDISSMLFLQRIQIDQYSVNRPCYLLHLLHKSCFSYTKIVLYLAL